MRRFLLVLLVCVSGLYASLALGFQLSPASLEKELKAGAKDTLILNVGNSEPKAIACRIYTTGFEVLKDGKQVFEQVMKEHSGAKWLKPKEAEFEVPAQSHKEVEVVLSIPRSTVPGSYFACIFAETTAPSRAKTPQGTEISIGVNLRLGCITRITVTGRTVQKKAEISEVRVEVPNLSSEEWAIKVIATFQNNCRLHLDTKGEALIKNSAGRVFDKFVLQGAGRDIKGEALVYPEGARDFWGMVERPLPPGEYIAEVSFDYGYHFRKARAQTSFVVSPELGEKQKGVLIMSVEPSLLELKMSSGAFRTHTVKVFNLDFELLKVEVTSLAYWLRVQPERFIIQSEDSQVVRVDAYIPVSEPVERTGKVLIKPERGKEVIVDVVVSARKGKERE